MLRYGLIKEEHLEDIALVVCNVLGHGKNKTAMHLLLETAGAETHRGKVKDRTVGAGMGITQFDKLPFQDVKDRCSDRSKELIKEAFDIYIELVEWEDLRYNPLLAMIFTRLKYKKVPSEIPKSIEDRAFYWRKYYNGITTTNKDGSISKGGKGTEQHYLDANVQDFRYA